ncbi:hypothetical protein [Microbacterium sp. NPDC056234]|uniref:hypothetical protein n=1 Tax=Microbacterium sp. NPDC056234 TaxID=3345757 RepID=UPI0035DEE908
MSNRIRSLLLLTAVLGGAVIAAVTLLRLLAPDAVAWTDDLAPTFLERVGGTTAESVIVLCAALGAVAVAVLAATTLRTTNSSLTALRVVGLLVAAIIAFGTPGGVIPAAGYTFALLVPIGIVVATTLLAIRRPWIGVPVALLVIAVVVYAATNLEGASLLPSILAAMVGILPTMLMSLAHALTAASLLTWVIGVSVDTRGSFARGVLRHRVAITVVAALCAVPYTFARLTWLTPWPMFGGSAEMFAESPGTQLTGLMLGSAILFGGVLTLGLVRPWGERFPRWMAGLGGRAVPPALAILPAGFVSVLFTAGGIEFAAEGLGSPAGTVDTLYVMAMFPFWLWGPLLGLAAWAYAMHRADRAAPAQDAEDKAARARAMAHLAEIESREA